MSKAPDPEIYQLDEALATFGSEAIVKEALKSFLEVSSSMMDELVAAWRTGDHDLMKQKLHWLKGGLSYLHARPLRKACLELDLLVHEEPMPDIQESLDRVCVELTRLNACAREYIGAEAT